MKNLIKRLNLHLLLLLLTDSIYVFVSWIISPDKFKYISAFIILFTIIICTFEIVYEYVKHKKISAASEDFIEMQNEEAKTALLNIAGLSYTQLIENVYTQIVSQNEKIKEKTLELDEYREYIEEWVHEVKTPLSLSALVISNHKEDMSEYVYSRMSYIQSKLNEDIEQILFYARLQANHADYKFTKFRLDICVKETVNEYMAFMSEKNISPSFNLTPVSIVSDKKIVSFILSQLISNAVKYSDANEGKISFHINCTETEIHLCIRNNGKGVLPEDAPFIFDKGFTGNIIGNQKATGMGLYLVRKYAEKLCAKVELEKFSPRDNLFGIKIIFPL